MIDRNTSPESTAAVRQCKLLKVSVENRVCKVSLNRPEVHNAFNPDLIEELRHVFEEIGASQADQVRVAVLSGEGRSFCAGADVNWMRESLQYSEQENVSDALRMARMFDTINRCPVPVIGRVHGLALGGGAGLVAVCDVVVAAESALFAFSEAKLGIAPAVISPYVLSKISKGQARALFLTAERFDAQRAMRIGLVHSVVPAEGLDAEVERVTGEVLTSAPRAITRAKELIEEIPGLSHIDAMQRTAETIAALRTSPQGQEGLRAFLEKRKPDWTLQQDNTDAKDV